MFNLEPGQRSRSREQHQADGADKKAASLIEVSLHQRWLMGALFSLEMSVCMYEQRGEGSLSHFQRHVLHGGQEERGSEERGRLRRVG